MNASCSISVLGSGSRGNCTALVFNERGRRRCALIDCGLSVRATRLRLEMLGLGLDDITDILITHFDRDHVQPRWSAVAETQGIRLHVHRAHRYHAARADLPVRHTRHYADTTDIADAVHVTAVHLAHDDAGSVGFVIDTGRGRLGFATDLGRVPQHLYDAFIDLDMLAIESNYDVRMQDASDRPWFLKKRITGGRGHLSNDQSMHAVMRIAHHSPLSNVVLLHLSQQCNCPDLVRRLYAQRLAALAERLIVADQHAPTALLPLARSGSSRLLREADASTPWRQGPGAEQQLVLF